MFKFLRNKLLNKKWLNACLLLGIVLLVAVASCNPMFKNGAMDMTLASKFDSAIEQHIFSRGRKTGLLLNRQFPGFCIRT